MWQSSSYNNNNNNKRSDNRVSRPYLGKCQYCHVQGHSARRCPHLQSLQPPTLPPNNTQSRPWQPRANLAAGAPYNATNWLVDSGATHHITTDLNNLSLHQPYHGGDDVLIADGSSLDISHTGSTFLPSYTRDLKLNKVLCVPNIAKNLISVYRLCLTKFRWNFSRVLFR